MREGIGNTYTLQVLYDDFMLLTTNTWEIYPALAYRRTNDGIIVNNCTNDYRANQILRSAGEPVEHPARIIEDKGRGSEIHSLEDQGKLIQNWAWAFGRWRHLPIEGRSDLRILAGINPPAIGRRRWLDFILLPCTQGDVDGRTAEEFTSCSLCV
jgi:hypothetical protein